MVVGPYANYFFSAGVPFVFFVELGMTMAIHWCIWHYKRERAIRANDAAGVTLFPKSTYCRTLLALYLFSFMPISSAVIRYFDCRQYGTVKLVYAAPIMQCDTKEYYVGLFAAIAVLIVYIVRKCWLPVLCSSSFLILL